jgi:hypothetical protein
MVDMEVMSSSITVVVGKVVVLMKWAVSAPKRKTGT